ncbi:hypothetical protein [Fictibacillus sp. FJAT-27399]|uniref:hypothetical protein n=1 Tax=Fictibacillus sp. FJAT-27399 TaxID=1729689 RepID=UPI000783B287|nr:hypothetical protein [Fictibacillus sp. FJAT-27399]
MKAAIQGLLERYSRFDKITSENALITCDFAAITRENEDFTLDFASLTHETHHFHKNAPPASLIFVCSISVHFFRGKPLPYLYLKKLNNLRFKFFEKSLTIEATKNKEEFK